MRFYTHILYPVLLMTLILACDRRPGKTPSSQPPHEKTNLTQKPLLKQYGDLTMDDFIRHPVWINCHTEDYDEPWYDDTDEETFRPWVGTLPCDPDKGIFLVRAELTLADGTRFPGFITPQKDGKPPYLGTLQPCLFAQSGKLHGFWGGIRKFSREECDHVYADLGKDASKIFPIRFAVEKGFTNGHTSGEIPGFCSIKNDDDIEITK